MPINNCKFYYGEGVCSIEGSDAFGVEISYNGDAIVETKANGSKWVLQAENKIIVLSMGSKPLTDLFKYTGDLKIIHAIVSSGVAEGKFYPKKLYVTLHRVDNYSELLNTNAEDLTVKSEDLEIKNLFSHRKPKDIEYPIIKHQDTKTHNNKLYLENGTKYHGKFHIQTKDGSAFTGGSHTPNSRLLYTKLHLGRKIKGKLIPTTTEKARKLIRSERKKMRNPKVAKKIFKSFASKIRANK